MSFSNHERAALRQAHHERTPGLSISRNVTSYPELALSPEWQRPVHLNVSGSLPVTAALHGLPEAHDSVNVLLHAG